MKHHAQLLVGDDNETLKQAAFCRAQEALSPTDKSPESHPDCHILDNADKEITVALTREWRQIAFYLPNEATCNVFIMYHADKMNTSAQNALLSLLEEPPTPCLFLLLCKKQDALLPTIRSRLHKTILSGKSPVFSDEAQLWAENVYAAISDELKLIKQLLSAEKLPRTDLCEYLECLLDYTARMNTVRPLTKQQFFSTIGAIKQARSALDNNVGNGHTLAALAVKIFKGDTSC